MFSFDFETLPIQPGCPLPDPVSVAIYDHEEGETSLFHCEKDSYVTFQCEGMKPDYENCEWSEGVNGIEAVGMMLYRALEQGRKVVAQNAKYDLGQAFKHWPELVYRLLSEGLAYCTKLADKLYRTARGEEKFMTMSGSTVRTKHSLERLVALYFGADISGAKSSDSWRMRYGQLVDVPLQDWDQDAIEYAVDDALWAGACYRHQQRWECHNLEDMPRQVAAGVELTLSTCWGVRTDAEAIDKIEEKVEGHVETLEEVLEDLGVLRSDGSRNMAKLRSYVWEAYEGQPPLTDTGQEELEEGKRLPPKDLVEEAIKELRSR